MTSAEAVAQNNLRTLRGLLGLSDEAARAVVDVDVVITWERRDDGSRVLAEYLNNMLARTVKSVGSTAPLPGVAVEIVLGAALPACHARHTVFLGAAGEDLWIGTAQSLRHTEFPTERIFLLIAACYAAAAVVRLSAGSAFPHSYKDPIVFSPRALLAGRVLPRHPINIDRTYLAGCGAVGNAFVLGLSTFEVAGELHLVDHDIVDGGNLNRCLWFEAPHEGQSKAASLARAAQPAFETLKLIPRSQKLQDLEERDSSAWLQRLVIATDSRRSRRGVQREMPRDAFDSSTTGISEVVLHFNRALAPYACTCCVYHEDTAEGAQEFHIAETLGVSIEDVRAGHISNAAEQRILAKYPELRGKSLVNLSYESLFRELCGEQRLAQSERQQVLAPLSFVSALAGGYLALEFVLRVGAPDPVFPFNYWRASPWSSPVLELRSVRQRRLGCDYCGSPLNKAALTALWGPHGEVAEEGPLGGER